MIRLFRPAAAAILAIGLIVLGSLYLRPFLVSSSVLPQQDWRDKVDPAVLAASANGETEFIVYMVQKADLSAAYSLPNKEAMGRYVFDQLRAVAEASQPAVRVELDRLGIEYQAFWISNAIWVKGGEDAVMAVALRPEVAYVYPSGGGRLVLPPQEKSDTPESVAINDPNPEPGLLLVNADDVWTRGYLGQGVTVAGADTGVMWTHTALRGKYRGWNGAAADHNYNWHDGIHNPNTACPANGVEPCDDDAVLGGGHGSHTVGTMAGDDGATNRIGMAPDAKWIACRNMNNGVGVVPTYMECMQWFIAPTNIANQNPDPSKAPHVTNNSWGCLEACPPPVLQDSLQASRAAGIFYAVSAGNDGSQCSTVVAPIGRYPESFTVGATTHTTDLIAGFSSRGPVLGDPTAPTGLMKPNITAPGVTIRSSLRNGSYGNLSGTSMAGPHVAGLVALLISANPRLAGRVDRLEDIIENTAVRKLSPTQLCGSDTATSMPNNVYGWGRIDALAATLDALPPDAVDDIASTNRNVGVLISPLGNDTDPDNDILRVDSAGPASNGAVIPNEDGTVGYMPNSGFSGTDRFTYTICAPEGCAMASDTATVTVNVLAPTAANVSVSGRVMTADGYGIGRATVTISNAQGNSRLAMTNAFGYYRFQEVAAGEGYVFSVRAKRYTFEPRVVTVNDELTDLDFAALE